jgi:Uma2 family endonuclease
VLRAVGDSAVVRVQQPVRFMPRSEPQPDLALVRRKADAYRSGHPTAKDVLLLIEVSHSTLRYDLEDKARLYAKHRIPEYWVVDVANRRIVRHRNPSRGRYEQLDEIASGTVPLPIPGAELDLAELL